tara:strand:- start:824 stop:979 length:156 start_codon:yes stop_codon:yes gene_type:complete
MLSAIKKKLICSMCEIEVLYCIECKAYHHKANFEREHDRDETLFENMVVTK